MATNDLPVAPFEIREHYIRNGIGKTAVYGIDQEGYGYVKIEHDDLDEEFGLQVVDIPTKMEVNSDYHGVFREIKITWQKTLVTQTGKVVKYDYQSEEQLTNIPDLILFSAVFGVPMMPSMINGNIRTLRGFNQQPLFDDTMQRIPDESYDTTSGPTFDYWGEPFMEETLPEEPAPEEPAPEEPAA
jgi:hypothetical protein